VEPLATQQGLLSALRVLQGNSGYPVPLFARGAVPVPTTVGQDPPLAKPALQELSVNQQGFGSAQRVLKGNLAHPVQLVPVLCADLDHTPILKEQFPVMESSVSLERTEKLGSLVHLKPNAIFVFLGHSPIYWASQRVLLVLQGPTTKILGQPHASFVLPGHFVR